jgi:hypothetical protein
MQLWACWIASKMKDFNFWLWNLEWLANSHFISLLFLLCDVTAFLQASQFPSIGD